MPVAKTLSLKELRLARGLSQERLARRMDVSRQTVYYIERGEKKLTLRMAIAMALALEVPISEIHKEYAEIVAAVHEGKALPSGVSVPPTSLRLLHGGRRAGLRTGWSTRSAHKLRVYRSTDKGYQRYTQEAS